MSFWRDQLARHRADMARHGGDCVGYCRRYGWHAGGLARYLVDWERLRYLEHKVSEPERMAADECTT